MLLGDLKPHDFLILGILLIVITVAGWRAVWLQCTRYSTPENPTLNPGCACLAASILILTGLILISVFVVKTLVGE